MGSYVVLGSVVIVTFALIADASGTVSLITVIITVKGITFVVRKIVDSFNRENGDYINFVGNCLAGISAIGLIKNAIKGVEPVTSVLGKVGVFINGLGGTLDRIGQFIETVVPWGLE
jgi:hypothetical protein